jgi:hypothetical protein
MEEIIRYAREEDIPRLREIWAECFPDDKEYANFFFERMTVPYLKTLNNIWYLLPQHVNSIGPIIFNWVFQNIKDGV